MGKNIGQMGLKFGIVGLFILGLFMVGNMRNDSISNKLSKAKSVVVNNLVFDKDTLEEKKIDDKNKIDEIIKIIINGEKMDEGENIPYKSTPSYRLKFYDNKNSLIMKIEFYYYEYGLNWISYNDVNYEIDGKKLLDIIDNDFNS